jgi:hypothetical protein
MATGCEHTTEVKYARIKKILWNIKNPLYDISNIIPLTPKLMWVLIYDTDDGWDSQGPGPLQL